MNSTTPLHIAAVLDRPRVARILLEAEVDVSIANSSGETALDLARRKGHHAVVRLIEARAAR
jgi:ankyrin repeat protein